MSDGFYVFLTFLAGMLIGGLCGVVAFAYTIAPAFRHVEDE